MAVPTPPLVANAHKVHKMLSVWAFIGIILVSGTEAAAALYVPHTFRDAWIFGVGNGLLAILGIWFRVLAQKNCEVHVDSDDAPDQ